MGSERPHLTGFFISVELCDGNFEIAFGLSNVPKWSVCTYTYKGLANLAQQITESRAGIL